MVFEHRAKCQNTSHVKWPLFDSEVWNKLLDHIDLCRFSRLSYGRSLDFSIHTIPLILLICLFFCARDRGIDWLYMYGKSIIFCVIFCLIDSQWIISFEWHFVSHASNLIMFSLSFGCQAHCNLRLCLCARSLAYSLAHSLTLTLCHCTLCISSLIHLFHTLFSYNRSVSLSKQTNYRVYCHCITSN